MTAYRLTVTKAGPLDKPFRDVVEHTKEGMDAASCNAKQARPR